MKKQINRLWWRKSAEIPFPSDTIDTQFVDTGRGWFEHIGASNQGRGRRNRFLPATKQYLPRTFFSPSYANKMAREVTNV